MQIKDITYGTSGIYKMVFDNQKIYIGLSNDIRRRMNEHCGRDLIQNPDLLISKAIKKHKIIDVEILELIDADDREKLKEREKYWIKYYNSFNNKQIGYNMTPGGDGASKGIFNSASYIDEKTLEIIFQKLLYSTLTYEEIADITETSSSIVSRINNGVHYRKANLKYPLREERIEHLGVNNKHSSFYQKEENLRNLIIDLQTNILSYKELEAKYSIKTTMLSLINQGKKYRQSNTTYPLRPVDKGKGTRRVFSNDEMLYIKDKLENSSVPMAEIAKTLKCDRKVISNINLGERQNQPDWSYPLRNTSSKK